MVLLSAFAHGALPDNRQIKGLFNWVIEEKKYLSPQQGWLLLNNGFIEKIYTSGPEDDATTKLVRLLFHKLPALPYTFEATDSIGSIATYFNAETIGSILKAIETGKNISELSTQINKEIENIVKKKVIETKKNLYEKTINMLKTNFDKLKELRHQKLGADGPLQMWVGQKISLEKESDKNYFLWALKVLEATEKQIVKWFSNEKKDPIMFNEVYKTLKESEQSIKFVAMDESKDQNNLVNAYANMFEEKIQKPIKHLWSDLKNKKSTTYFIETLMNAYKEAGQFGDKDTIEESKQYQKYPQYTPTFILLAFLMSHIKNKDELQGYFKKFEPSILKQEAQNNMWNEAFELGKEPSLLDEKMANIMEKGSFENTLYEEICFATINWQTTSDPLPTLASGGFHLFPSNITNIQHYGPQNCVEQSIYNFVCILLSILGCINQGHFDLSELPKKIYALKNQLYSQSNSIEEIAEELEPFCNLFKNEKKEWMIPGETSEKAAQNWYDWVSSLKQVKYECIFDKEKKSWDKIECAVLTNDDEPMKHGTHNCKVLPIKNFLAHEITGFPSSYVEIVNKSFGLNFENINQLCQAFSITSDTDLSLINDDATYKTSTTSKSREASFTKVNFSCKIKNLTARFRIDFSSGHSGITSLHEKTSIPLKLFAYIKKNLANYLFRNIAYIEEDLFASPATTKDLAYLSILFNNKWSYDSKIKELIPLTEENPFFDQLLTLYIKNAYENLNPNDFSIKEFAFICDRQSKMAHDKKYFVIAKNIIVFFINKSIETLDDLSKNNEKETFSLLKELYQCTSKLEKVSLMILFEELFGKYYGEDIWEQPIIKKILIPFLEKPEIILEFPDDGQQIHYENFCEMFRNADKIKNTPLKKQMIMYLKENSTRIKKPLIFAHNLFDQIYRYYALHELCPIASYFLMNIDKKTQTKILDLLRFKNTFQNVIDDKCGGVSEELKELIMEYCKKKEIKLQSNEMSCIVS